ncbi:MAG: hypothetical protein SXA11_11740 [Cyanobacteriota bacterium]|nr:hypothetical protein [Cyanobacteriota bacterium]
MTNDIQPFLDNPQELTTQPIEVQLAVANNSATPRELLKLLVASENLEVARAAQNHVNWARELSEDCHLEAEKLLRNSNLGQNDVASATLRERLAVELLKFAPVPEWFLSEWVPASYLVLGVKNSVLPRRYRVKLLERLAREPFMQPRLEAAAHPDTPVSVLEKLAGDVELPVRVALRHHPNCPTEAIAKAEAQVALASNWETDAQQLAELAETPWNWVRRALAGNPSSPPSVLEKFAEGDCYPVQLAVGRNPSSPTAALEKLIGIDEQSMWEALAEHPNASEAMLLELLPDWEEIIIERANLPVGVIERLVEESNRNYKLLKQRNITTALLKRMLEIRPNYNPTEIARHPQAKASILEQLAKYRHPSVRLGVAQNPNSPAPLRAILYEELVAVAEDHICREIAADPNTPIFLLERIGDRLFSPNNFLLEVRRILNAELGLPTRLPANDVHYLDSDIIDMNSIYEDELPGLYKTRKILSECGVAVDVDALMGLLESDCFSDDWRGSYIIELNEETLGQWKKLLPTIPESKFEDIRSELSDIASYAKSNVKNPLPIAVALARNPNTPASLLERLQTKLNLPRQRYYCYLEWYLCVALAFNPAVPEAQRQEYLEEAIASEREEAISALVENPLTSTSILEQLIDRYGRIQSICEHPNAPLWFLKKTALEEEDNFTTLELIVSNPKTPPEWIEQLLEKFVLHPTDWKNFVYNLNGSREGFLKAALQNPNLDRLTAYRVRQELKKRSDTLEVYQYMASYRQKRPYLLMEVLEKGDRHCRCQVARRYDLPDFMVEQLARDSDESVRCAAVENRDLPLNLRLELTRDPSPKVRCEIARQNPYYEERLVPVPVLERLANDESQSVREVVAENPNTPVEVLAQLASDTAREVKLKVVSNPNTPVEILERLGLSEGIFDKDNSKTPGSVLARAVTQIRDRDKLADFLKYPVKISQMPGEILEELASHKYCVVRSQVARHPNAPASALRLLAKDDYSATRCAVSENPNTPADVLESLLRHTKPDDCLYATICKNLASRPDAPPSLLELLASNVHAWVRRTVAGRTMTPITALERFVNQESDENVLKRLAGNPSLTPELQARLAEHPIPDIRSHLIYNTNLTPELWQQLAADGEKSVRGALANFAGSPVASLETLAGDEDTEIRHKVAANPNTPKNVLETLSRDAAIIVRAAVAANNDAPGNILERLAEDEKVEVRRAVAENPATPTPVRESLRHLLSQSREAKLSPTLRGLGRIYNPETDDLPSLLSEYARSPVAFVRFVALMHPLTPAKALAEGSESLCWWERYAVADNPATPAEIRQRLAGDSDRIVRAVCSNRFSDF